MGEGEDAREVTVVGLARSVSDTADAWMTPAGLAALHPPATGYQMLYRLTDAGTASQVEAARDAVTAALPDGTVTSAKSWITVKQEANDQTSLFVPFLLTFGGLSLLLSVLIVGTVIAGAVGSTTRRIGILKALGFTPSQVVRAYVAQALIPATIGAVLGVVAGNLIAVPLLAQTEDLYGTVALTIAPWVDVVVLVGVLALVTVTASAAAGRAGRLSAVDALAVGRTPAARRGQYAARVAARLPLPRPVTMGLARPFGAPARAAAMVVAIAFGAAAVTLAAGLATSLNRVQVAAEHSGADIVVDGVGQRAAGRAADREARQRGARARRPGEGRGRARRAVRHRALARLRRDRSRRARPDGQHHAGRVHREPGLGRVRAGVRTLVHPPRRGGRPHRGAAVHRPGGRGHGHPHPATGRPRR